MAEEAVLEVIITAHFPQGRSLMNLKKEMEIRHIIVKWQNTKDKEKILKATRDKITLSTKY